MIAKSEFSEAVSDIALLMEKQIPDFSRNQIIDILEVLNTSDDQSLPVLVLGKDGVLLFRYQDKHMESVTREKLLEILDYEEFLKTGNITLKGEKEIENG